MTSQILWLLHWSTVIFALSAFGPAAALGTWAIWRLGFYIIRKRSVA